MIWQKRKASSAYKEWKIKHVTEESKNLKEQTQAIKLVLKPSNMKEIH